MKILRFTKASLLAIEADRNKRLEFADSVVQGLRLRVTPTGVKSFCVTRYRDKKFIRATLGRFPDLTVEMARAKALEVLGEVAKNGKNPNDERRVHAMSLTTLAEALSTYTLNRGERISQKTKEQYLSILTNFSGDWFTYPIANITREEVARRHKAITEGSVWFGKPLEELRAGVGNGSKAQADLWGRVLRAIYRYAHDHYRDTEGNRLLPDPPTAVLSTKRQWHGTTRKTSRIRNNQLSRWLDSVNAVRNKATEKRDDFAVAVCDVIDVALFTGLRRSEVFGLAWDRVNMGGRYFWIDKTKNGDVLELPITDTLATIFHRRLELRRGDEPLVFPGHAGGVIQEPRRVLDLIMEATSEGGTVRPIKFTCHDARRTFGSVAELAGTGQYILKRLMNHRTMRSADVTQGYLHFSADELQDPARRVERAILEHSGRIEKAGGLDNQLLAVMGTMTDEDKRRMLFTLLNASNDEVQS
ncbi:Site-specific recombinase XerD [Serratia plymuthica]|nr:Site-specific recombinase XerD [Serratia plymuthica]